MVELILKDIEDPFVRENFFRLSNFLNRQVWFDGDFQLFDVTIPEQTDSYKIRHGLSFIPADIIPLAAEGNYNFFFRYNDFDRENIYIRAEGPVRIRFLAGKLLKQVKSRLTGQDLTFVPPGPASPGFVYGAVNMKISGFWLTTEGIPSNVVGVPVLFAFGKVVQVAVGTETEANYTIGIYQHEGNNLNMVELGQVPITVGGPKRITVDFPVQYTSENIQIAVRLLSGITRNLKVSLVLKGSVL